MRKVLLRFGIALLFVCLPTTAMAQAVYGSIVGTVTDASGAAVPSAKITILDVGKGVTFNTTSNESGNYSQGHLIVGVYEIRVEAPGFQTTVQKNATVNVDATTQVDVKLTVGSV